MSIVKLIISILFPPIGLFINMHSERENKLDKISYIISIVLTLSFVALIVFVIITINLNIKQEDNLKKCRAPQYCDISDDEYVTCYYCKEDGCKNPEKIRCLNDEEAVFNYRTVSNPEDE